MRVFVTGASGFVGGHLLPALQHQGWEVFSADREVDVTRRDAVAEAFRRARPDSVIHLAAQSSVAASFGDPLDSFRINFIGSLNVLSAIRCHSPDARVLLIGSSDCYGPQPESGPLTEDRPLLPESPYARSKAAAELLGANEAARGLDVMRVRSFTHIGVGQTDRFVTPSFARQIAEIAEGRSEALLRVGNLDSVRDFLDVRDVVAAYCRLLDRSVPAGVYNVASGRGVSIRTVLDELLSLAGVSARVEIDPDRFRPADHRVGDASKLRNATGWKPEIPLRRTLRDLLAYWRDRVRSDALAASS